MAWQLWKWPATLWLNMRPDPKEGLYIWHCKPDQKLMTEEVIGPGRQTCCYAKQLCCQSALQMFMFILIYMCCSQLQSEKAFSQYVTVQIVTLVQVPSVSSWELSYRWTIQGPGNIVQGMLKAGRWEGELWDAGFWNASVDGPTLMCLWQYQLNSRVHINNNNKNRRQEIWSEMRWGSLRGTRKKKW